MRHATHIPLRHYALSLMAAYGMLVAQAYAQTAVNPAPAAPPAVVAPAATPAAPVPAANPAAAPSLVLAGVNVPEPIKIKSLFFSPEEIADIHYAVNIYKKNSKGRVDDEGFDEEDFLNRLTGLRKAPETNRYYQYPQFFLESLVYHAPDNWITWINGQKITQATPTENSDLSVVGITQDKIDLVWRPISMEKVNEIWDKSPNTNVKVNKRQGTVYFTLKPNQTFSSYVMNVLEGKVKPVTVDTHAIEIRDSGEEEPPPAEEPAPVTGTTANPAPAGEDSRRGLGGLIGAYSRLGSGQDEKPADAPQPGLSPPLPITPPQPVPPSQ